jgi:DNA-binding transcriptional regulator YhcF (GntR family)
MRIKDTTNTGEVATIELDELDPAPKYAQIVAQVKAHVAAGRLRAGMALPSVRQLAGDLGINVNTVLAAYRALEAEQVILLRHGSRAVVHPRLNHPSEPQPVDIARVRRALAHVRVEALLAGMTIASLRALADEVWLAPAQNGPGSLGTADGKHE